MSKPDTVMPVQTMTAPASMPLLKPATSHEVRSKFFNLIGIDGSTSPSFAAPTPPRTARPALDNQSRQHQAARLEETLKYDRQADQRFSPKRKSADTDTTSISKKRISFHDKVHVVPIPMRNEYSNRVRSRLWSNALEIHENATRNSLEFAAEGWDWRAVMEDDNMYVDTRTGELVHPIHYEYAVDQSSEL